MMAEQQRINFVFPLATVFLALTIFFGNSVQILDAQKAPAPGASPAPFTEVNQNNGAQNTDETVQKADPVLCQSTMKKLANDELKDFRHFLETNFQNKSSTASLLDGAIGKYRELREEMMDAYAKYYPNQGSSQLITALQPGVCLKIIEDSLDEAKILLKVHAIHTSGVKKSAALLEKYQSINNQLSGMSQQFMTLKALLDSFSQKLPCYVPKGQCLRN